jgi:hypothetical protein
MHGREPASITNRQYRRRTVTAQSTWKNQVAGIVAAWAFRNWRQVVPVWRFGAGGIRRALGIRRIVEAPARWPGLSSSPWIGWYPRLLFWVAGRSMSAVIPVLAGGRLVRFGQVCFLGDQAAVSAQDGAGCDRPVRPQLMWQEPD